MSGNLSVRRRHPAGRKSVEPHLVRADSRDSLDDLLTGGPSKLSSSRRSSVSRKSIVDWKWDDRKSVMPSRVIASALPPSKTTTASTSANVSVSGGAALRAPELDLDPPERKSTTVMSVRGVAGPVKPVKSATLGPKKFAGGVSPSTRKPSTVKLTTVSPSTVKPAAATTAKLSTMIPATAKTKATVKPATVRPIKPLVRPKSSLSHKSSVPPCISKSTPSDPVTRQMIDRDTLRLRGRDDFIKGIAQWRRTFLNKPQDCARDRSFNGVSDSPLNGVSDSSSNALSSVSVFVRKRPISQRELQKGEFDIVSVVGGSRVVTHNCLYMADLKRGYLGHNEFEFSGCFGELVGNGEIFAQTAESFCMQTATDPNFIGTLFVFGQTGSGKTYTMSSIESQAANYLFAHQDRCYITFLELSGKKVFDLLASDTVSPSLRLRERANGSVFAENALEVETTSASELISLMQSGHAKRHTTCTEANDTSSRSHVVCTLRVPGGGKLMLVDLAGSERRKDSMHHDRDRRAEGAEINASLHALKECIRWRFGVRSSSVSAPAPIRLSSLTRVLAECFIGPAASLCVIATVSPCATDVEHTITTLKTVHLLTGKSEAEIKETKQFPLYTEDKVVGESQTELPPHPKRWSFDHISTWLHKVMGEPSTVSIPKATTGAMLVRMSATRFVQLCEGDERRGVRLFRDLHDRIVAAAQR